MSILAIDPGISGSGYALFTAGSRLIEYGVLVGQPTSKGAWDLRADIIAGSVVSIAYANEVSKIVIEFPQMFGVNAASRSGGLLKLASLCGLIRGGYGHTRYITPTEWKGQLSKELVEKRLRAKLGDVMKDAKSHAIDAIGIGLYHFGIEI